MLDGLEAGFIEMFDGPEGPVRAEAFTKGLAAFKVTNKGIEIAYADGTLGQILEAEARGE